MMRRVLFQTGLFVLVSGLATAADPQLVKDLVKIRGVPLGERHPRLDAAITPAEPGEDRDLPISRAEIEVLRRRLQERRGDGAGGDVADLVAIQVTYAGATGCPLDFNADGQNDNGVLLLWTENQPNPGGVDVLVDDMLVTTVTDGSTAITIFGVPAGAHTFAVEEGDTGTRSEVQLEVVDDQPVADAGDVRFQEGPTVDQGGDPVCTALASWDNNCPVPDAAPDSYILLVRRVADGTVVAALGAEGVETFSWFGPIPGAGEYTAEVVGFKRESPDNPNAQYRTCFPASDPVTFTCDPTTCDVAPVIMTLLQIGYAQDTPAYMVYLEGFSVGYPEGLQFLTDGADAGTLDFGGEEGPFLVAAWFSFDGASDVTLGLQGHCSDTESSEIVEDTFTILDQSPHQNPVEGDICCTWSPEGAGATTAEWTNADCSSKAYVFKLTDPEATPTAGGLMDLIDADLQDEADVVQLASGAAETTTFEDTIDTDRLGLLFTTYVDGDEYAAPLGICVDCGGPSEWFIPGICSADPSVGPNPQLTEGIFVLNFLFRGGSDPHCKAACDTDGDGNLRLTDGVVIFRYLFAGGPAPAGWVGNTPTCVPVTDEVRDGPLGCEQGNTNCPL